MIITLPWPPSILNPNSGGHWAVKASAKKGYKHDCMWSIKTNQKPANLTGKIPLLIRFRPPDYRHRDMDNMLASIKSGLDGVAEKWGVNDRQFLLTLDIGPAITHGAVEIECN